jgi:hypothetical protein
MLKATLFSRALLSCALSVTVYGQDRHDWQSLARLQAGDRVRVSLKTGPADGEFQSWTPRDLKVGTIMAKREDVLKIVRYRHGGSRDKHSGVGTLIGFGGGFAIGASVPWCVGLGPCGRRPGWGVIVGGAGAAIGALVGASLPTHSKEVIYSSR